MNADEVLLDIDLTSSGNVDFPRGHFFIEWARSSDGKNFEGTFKVKNLDMFNCRFGFLYAFEQVFTRILITTL